MTKKKTLVIDFDGTIVTHAFPYIGAAKPGAIDTINKLANDYNIIICSCRNNPKIRHQGNIDTFVEMEKWLIEKGVKFDEIDDGTTGKPIADYYIDDRAIGFTDWAKITL